MYVDVQDGLEQMCDGGGHTSQLYLSESKRFLADEKFHALKAFRLYVIFISQLAAASTPPPLSLPPKACSLVELCKP